MERQQLTSHLKEIVMAEGDLYLVEQAQGVIKAHRGEINGMVEKRRKLAKKDYAENNFKPISLGGAILLILVLVIMYGSCYAVCSGDNAGGHSGYYDEDRPADDPYDIEDDPEVGAMLGSMVLVPMLMVITGIGIIAGMSARRSAASAAAKKALPMLMSSDPVIRAAGDDNAVCDRLDAMLDGTRKDLDDRLFGLYSQGVIDKQFWEYAQAARLLELTESGECAALEGKDGAYARLKSELAKRKSYDSPYKMERLSDKKKTAGTQKEVYRQIERKQHMVSELDGALEQLYRGFVNSKKNAYDNGIMLTYTPGQISVIAHDVLSRTVAKYLENGDNAAGAENVYEAAVPEMAEK